MHSLDSIRQKFLNYFESKGHRILPSFSLIPHNDPTLLFINSGMAPLKNCFTGLEQPIASTIATCQKCLRVGGKHNDFEQIGYTKRHHTFFEMLGNFSFFDYFQEQAIEYAWVFLTEHLNLDKSKLYITVHPDDEQAFKIWQKFVNEDRITKLAENEWSMGDSGPCGWCSEIFFDLGQHLSGNIEEGDRYLEIWNLVFMSKVKAEDGSVSALPHPCIDTGSGLERLSVVLNRVDDTYSIPEMLALINKIKELTNCNDQAITCTTLRSHASQEVAYKVLADHIRAIAFLVIDSVTPSAEGRGYILRKLIRRSARFAHTLNDPYLTEKLLPTLVDVMGKRYSQLHANYELILNIIKEENKKFVQVLEKGMEKIAAELISTTQLSGEFVFLMYDTFGFPIELIKDIAREKNIDIDMKIFDQLIAQQKAQSRKHHQKKELKINPNLPASLFVGYERATCDATILDIIDDQYLILDTTPFYAESGGQIADKGFIKKNNCDESYKILDVMNVGQFILHKTENATSLNIGDKVICSINVSKRTGARRYHTATHLLHAALKQILGSHVQQKGSLVEDCRLRFDFSHDRAMSETELIQVEELINHWIEEDYPVNTSILELEEALKKGATALFGEKYAQKVRVVEIEDVNDTSISMELCGGTHVKSLAQIGRFKITKEQSCGSGIRRIEAIAGKELIENLVQKINENEILFDEICSKLKATKSTINSKLDKLLNINNLEQILINSAHLIVAKLSLDKKTTQHFLDKNKQIDMILLLDDAPTKKFVIRFNAQAVKQYGSAVNFIKKLNLNGGGNDNLAQGLIEDEKLLIQALENIGKW